jgi:peptidoglycan/xylan/chitin deacetylase (PgdA/CDA1 family)
MVFTMRVFASGAGDGKISYDSVPTTLHVVAITFDDGPSPMLTPQVLKILADRNIKATFFAAGESVQAHPEIIKQEVSAGHEVGSRSWSHTGFSDLTGTQWLTDLQHTDQAIKLATGRSPRYYSPFDAAFSDVQCDTVSKQFGYKVIYWNVDSQAVQDKGAAAIAGSIVSQVKPGSIILSSDVNAASVEALPLVIDTLTAKGYKFVTVPQLLALGTPAGLQKYLAANPGAAPAPPPPTAQDTRPINQSNYGGDSHPFGERTPPPGVTTPSYFGGSQ